MYRQTQRIVVGYDGSGPADAAVDWAAALARRRGLPLTVLSVIDAAGMLPGFHDISPSIFQERASQLATLGAQRALTGAAGSIDAGPIDVTAVGGVGQVAAKLLEASQEAVALVLGGSGRSELVGAMLGSVSFAVSAHAHCPVVVVQEESPLPGPDRPVIVGVDGSLCARIALRQAADLAAETGAALTVVTSHHSLGGPELQRRGQEAAQQVAEIAASAASQLHDTLQVEVLTVAGHAQRELPRLAKGYGLLVVGTRGFGGFTGLLLGSVSHGALVSAPCPVMVVPVVAD